MTAPQPFTYEALPMRVTLGPGAVSQLPDEMANAGLERVLVLCSPEQQQVGESIAASLGDRAA